MANSESITASVDNTSAFIGASCFICGDTVTIANYCAGSEICDKSKEATLYVGQFLDTTALDTCPCNDCGVGWGSLSADGYEGCENTCEKFAKWIVAKWRVE